MASPEQFTFDVPRIGAFTFRMRTMRLNIAVEAEYSRLTEGVLTPTVFLDTVATWMANLRVLVVAAPDTWKLDDLDPTDADTYRNLKEVFDALRAKENDFREPKAQVGNGAGQGGGGELPVPVPAPVQHAADGPQVP